MRIVSLCPSLTELTAQLGRGAALVGRTRFCVHPVPLVRSIEVVGGTKDPDVDRVVALEPDLVLLNAEENRREDHGTLLAAGVRCHVSLPRSVDDAVRVVRDLGQVLHSMSEAESQASAIEQAVARFALERAATVRYAYLIWRKPWMAAGPGTYVDGLFAGAGGDNAVVGERGSYPELELASLRTRGVQRVLLSSEPFRFQEKHRAEVAEATGLALQAVRLVDGEACSWHGSKTLVGLEAARDALFGVEKGPEIESRAQR